MKTNIKLIGSFMLMASVVGMPILEARGGNRGGGMSRGGGGHSAKMNRGSSMHRTPMTGTRAKPKNYSRPSSRPSVQPSNRPSTRPSTRPNIQPSNRPSAKPSVRPAPKPSTRPSTKPSTRPSVKSGDLKYAKPSVGVDGRPIDKRPSTRPSTKPAERPNVRPGNRPSNKLPNVGKPIGRPPVAGKPNRPGARPGRPGNLPNRPGVGKRPGGGNIIGNDIDINFERNINWSVDSRHWGGRPWWGCGSYYPWHHGHWRYGWHYRPYYYTPGRVFAWGLIGWGIGSLIFDCGYHSYYNPYPTQTVIVYNDGGNSNLDYSQPVTSSAEDAIDDRSGMSEEESDTLAAKASKAFDEALEAFKKKDYPVALKKSEEAISYDPGETVQHEFRALCLFALKKYTDSASVLNSVLSSNPGWGWDTMIGLYDNSGTYEAQLRDLENYAEKNAKDSAAQFLLGYHYMTAGHLREAEKAFADCVAMQPRDQVAKQLLDLTKNSSTGDSEGSASPDAREYNPPELDAIHGNWTVKSGNGTIKLSISNDNKFVWNYDDGENPFKLEGDASMDDGLLVLAGEESQIVAAIEMKNNDTLNFVIASGNDNDPGLDFKKS